MRRTLFIVIPALILVIIVGIGVYLYLNRSTVSTTSPGGVGLPVAGNASGQGSSQGSSSNQSSEPSSPVAVTPRLVEISAGPVVPGEIVLGAKAAASSTASAEVRFIERESGDVFSYAASSRTLTRISNKTLPGIQSASWFPDGSMALVQYLSGNDSSTVNTYVLPAATSTSGFFLPQDLAGASVSPLGIFTLASGANGASATLERLDGTKPATVFTTPLSSLRASPAGKNAYLVFSKPSSSLEGDAFLVSADGSFSRIAGPANGLTALASPSGAWALVSSVSGSALQMSLVNTATNAPIPLPIATIADKCVWTADSASIYCGIPQNPSASNAYPDDWYQGVVHFSDKIWRIDVAGRYVQFVLDFSSVVKGDLDAEALAIDPAATTLVFMNKNDSSLWSYSL